MEKNNMNKRKFAILFDDLDKTTIDRNVGLLAQFLANKKIEVEIITSKQAKNKNVTFRSSLISISRLKVGPEWPELNHENFKKYLRKNINSYFAIWVYRGRPYTEWVINEANKRNILSVIKLDSDLSISRFGNIFIKICNKTNLNPNLVYFKIKPVLKLLSIIPSVKGFIKYDAIFYNASLVLCETPYIENKIKNYFPNTKTFLFPNNIPVGKFSALEKNFNTRKQNKIISVGRITPIKQFEIAIQAYYLLPKQIKDIWDFEIIGPIVEIEYYQELIKLIKKLRLEKKVRIVTGLYKKKLYMKYNEASIFLLSSKIEGQPNVITEAMYFKNAIITSNFPGVNYLINNFKDGIILSSTDPETTMSALQTLITNKNKVLALGNNAKAKVVKNFNTDVIGKDLLNKLKEIDYRIYLNDQSKDALATDPNLMKKIIYKYLDFFTERFSNKINFFEAKILDIGCREFFTYDYFAKKYNNKITGVDIGEDALSFADKKNIINADIQEIDKLLKNNHYDVIFAFHVLEHMYNLKKVLINCNKLLKPRGIIFFAIPIPSIDTRRGHWVNIPVEESIINLLNSLAFKKLYTKTFKNNEFRKEQEMLGIFQKTRQL